MSREDLYIQALSKIKNHQCLILELPTGVGKSKIAIDLINSLNTTSSSLKILLLVAKTVHKQNWQNEIVKWGGFKGNPTLIVECYNSLKKHTEETFDIVLCDEVHHLQSELRLELFQTLKTKKIIGLSATVSRELKYWFCNHYTTSILSASLQEVIREKILPKPEIILMPLTLDDKKKSEVIEINPNIQGVPIIDDYRNVNRYFGTKKHIKLKATPKEKLMWYNEKVLYKKRAWERVGFEGLKFQWLKLCAERLQFLAYSKNDIVIKLLNLLDSKRTITFCNSIEQTEVLGKYCIHSKNGQAENTLKAFNDKKINHITACQMLNEGVNLTECQYGIFANLNSSKTIQVQRFGRLLRHEHPKIIIPFYVNSREEEIVEKMLENYDRELIKTFNPKHL